MITKQQTSIINYLVICINDFAERFNLNNRAAYRFLSAYGGIDFLMEHYEAEHTLSIDDALEDLEKVCRDNGGVIG
jgi:hypothetical protein